MRAASRMLMSGVHLTPQYSGVPRETLAATMMSSTPYVSCSWRKVMSASPVFSMHRVPRYLQMPSEGVIP